jgi:hypothetical protein
MKQQPDLQRIKPFLLLLASDQAGEVVAASAALVRTLKATGHDLHDLFQIIQSAATPAPKNPKPEPEWRDTAKAILAHHREHSSLNEKELGFVKQIAAQRWEPSEKQLSWLDSIYSKIFADDK